ncbi:MAG: hypothetical protein R3217_09665 [Gammaproteobacteria bacterium]|nr:hypothetical protein [Gammaproteobacteria bacterium]
MIVNIDKHLARLALLSLLLAMPLASAGDPASESQSDSEVGSQQDAREKPRTQQNQGRRGGRPWGGIEARMCGAEITRVATDGTERVFYPPTEYFEQFEAEVVNQGEMDRKAIAVTTLLEQAGATAVRFTDCRDRELSVAAADAKAYLLVMTGKGVIKLARVMENGGIDTEQRRVRRIVFQADGVE